MIDIDPKIWRDPPELQGSVLQAPITSIEGRRSAEAYRNVANQFDVERSPRYVKNTRSDGHPSTWCNRFVCDVLDAMGVGIPYQRANEMQDWFRANIAKGWVNVGPKLAMFRASCGYPTVVTYKNPDVTRSGHVAIVMPAKGNPGLWIAQAGVTNHAFILEERTFGRLPVLYFSHP